MGDDGSPRGTQGYPPGTDERGSAGAEGVGRGRGSGGGWARKVDGWGMFPDGNRGWKAEDQRGVKKGDFTT
jgi:hypothetical protein